MTHFNGEKLHCGNFSGLLNFSWTDKENVKQEKTSSTHLCPRQVTNMVKIKKAYHLRKSQLLNNIEIKKSSVRRVSKKWIIIEAARRRMKAKHTNCYFVCACESWPYTIWAQPYLLIRVLLIRRRKIADWIKLWSSCCFTLKNTLQWSSHRVKLRIWVFQELFLLNCLDFFCQIWDFSSSLSIKSNPRKNRNVQ